MMVYIQTIGFNLLNENEKNNFQELFNRDFVRIQRKIKNISSFVFHLKEYKKDGKREKFSIHSRIVLGNKVIEADSSDWDFRKTIRKVFNKLEQELEHKFHLTSYRDHLQIT